MTDYEHDKIKKIYKENELLKKEVDYWKNRYEHKQLSWLSLRDCWNNAIDKLNHPKVRFLLAKIPNEEFKRS